MATIARARAAGGAPRKPRARRARLARGLPALRALGRGLRRAGRLLLAAPLAVRLAALAVALVIVWSAANWTYQVIRKPSELFFPVSGTLTKAPAETWRSYAPLFRRHATATISPELLAALAQVEGAGDPVARTYWRWQVAWHPFEVYRPASSAVGMYQITDPTFREAKRFCVRDHVVAEDECWFRGLYTRVLPSHAVELTSAMLDRMVARTLDRRRIIAATLRQKQDLAAIIHLCGEGAGDGYARRGFRFTPGQQCGDHDAARYLAQVNGMKRQFARLAAGESSISAGR
jgi:transglycosylase-like protein with SLT domain